MSPVKVLILHAPGTNRDGDLAEAVTRAGGEVVITPLSMLRENNGNWRDYGMLALPGGFSYGDVLGAGQGWAKSVLFHDELRDMFSAFFARPDSFSLGVCNGCQMLSSLAELIPGTAGWPRFVRNVSEQFEARFSQVEVLDSASLFLQGMQGAVLPIAVAHGEGRADFGDPAAARQVLDGGLVALRYLDGHGRVAETYPANPNGSPLGITGLTTTDGRVTIMMPHPERVFRSVQNSWHPDDWGEDAPWMRMFRNARVWVG